MKSNYNWTYAQIGGAVRVVITSGEDIAHLRELDQKLWTALSCPTEGLEMDSATLKCVDSDNDGAIRVPDIEATGEWLTGALVNPDLILEAPVDFPINGFNQQSIVGKALYETAVKLVGDKNTINLSDIKYDTLQAPQPAKDPVLVAYEAVASKIDDYFVRCKLVAFDSDALGSVDVPVDKIAAIASDNLSNQSALEALPLARPSAESSLNLAAINPAWQNAITAFTTAANYKGKTITEKDWTELKAKMAEISASAPAVETVDLTPYKDLEKFLRLMKDFYQLLRNFVVFSDFYSREERAIFEAGKLYIDRRSCRLCVRVKDMSKHSDMASQSGMFLIYCHCTHKLRPGAFDIVAVMTDGGTRNLRVGTNAIFYDRAGQDWDAVVTKIVDNPINIRGAFWSPYIKFWNFCVGILNKSAAEKESKVTAELEAKANNLVKDPAAATSDNKGQAFDIAKFAGIFAALGMGLGMLADAVMGFCKGLVALEWWQILAFAAGLMLVISGPSCFLAWTKIRKRNLGPVLNANGWAINAEVIVSTLFGATLTQTAKYPLLKNLKKGLKKKNKEAAKAARKAEKQSSKNK